MIRFLADCRGPVPTAEGRLWARAATTRKLHKYNAIESHDVYSGWLHHDDERLF